MKCDKAILTALRQAGFRRTWHYRGNCHAYGMVEYKKGEDNYIKGQEGKHPYWIVQLWEDGGHRVSRGFNGRENELPICFTDAASMQDALARLGAVEEKKS